MVSYQQQTGTNKRYGMLRCILNCAEELWEQEVAGSNPVVPISTTPRGFRLSRQSYFLLKRRDLHRSIREFDNRRALIRHRRAVAKTFYVKTLRGSNLAVWVPIWLQD